MAHKNSITAAPKVKESPWGTCHSDCLRLWLGRQKMPPVWKQMNKKSCPELFLPYQQTSARLVRWEQCELQEEQAAAVLVLSNSLAEGRNSSRLVSSIISFVIHFNSHCNEKHSIAITKRSWFSIFKNGSENQGLIMSRYRHYQWVHTIYLCYLYCEFTHAKYNHPWRAQPMKNSIHQSFRPQYNTVCLGESGFFLD